MHLSQPVGLLLVLTLCAGATAKEQVSFQQKSSTPPKSGFSLSRKFQPDSVRLLSTATSEAEWAVPDELIDKGVRFMDVTDHLDLDVKAEATRERHRNLPLLDLPMRTTQEHVVRPMLGKLKEERMRDYLTKLSSFENRYFRSEAGVQSSSWLYETVRALAQQSKLNVTVQKFGHSWPQSSLIARIFPSDRTLQSLESTPTVIVGSHQDTVRGGFLRDGRAPGADDDGSGSTSTLEAFTVLLESGYQPTGHILEFHWYSAEEVGLRGSQDVAARYQRDGRLVKGMLQLDMTGYVASPQQEEIGIITDYTDPQLTEFLRQLVLAYANIPAVDSTCNYGCSDHASWDKAGFRSAFPFEGKFENSSPFIHSKSDTLEHVHFGHMKEFSKVALAFAVELSTASSIGATNSK